MKPAVAGAFFSALVMLSGVEPLSWQFLVLNFAGFVVFQIGESWPRRA